MKETLALTNMQAKEQINQLRKNNSLPLVETSEKMEQLAQAALKEKAYVNSFKIQCLMKQQGLMTNAYSLALVSLPSSSPDSPDGKGGGEVKFLPELILDPEFDLAGYAETRDIGLLVLIKGDKPLNLKSDYFQSLWQSQVGVAVKVAEELNNLAKELVKSEQPTPLQERISKLYPKSKGFLTLSAIGLNDHEVPMWLHGNRRGLAQCKEIGLAEVKPNGFLLLGVYL